MSKRTHEKELARARAKRRREAAAKRRRNRLIAVAVVVALGIGGFALALALRGDDSVEVTQGDTETGTDPNEAAAGDEASDRGTELETVVAAEPCPPTDDAPDPTATPYDAPPAMTIDKSATYVATIETTCGTVVVELAASDAPLTVNNFVFLAEDDYYRGAPFHRVIDGFMIQGGDPTGTGRGFTDDPDNALPGYRFKDELDLAEQIVADEGGYPRGVIAMANAGPDTQGSQFFIVQAPTPYPLPPSYTIFGRVTEGIDIVDRIAAGPVEGELAVDPVRILDVTIEKQGGGASEAPASPSETSASPTDSDS
ncbi:MAG: peptidylprolyl isomerase [Nitriliruptorales bacterium]|nr:peptidylprolyl isomerase [Nitriliruptorales bacterium]